MIIVPELCTVVITPPRTASTTLRNQLLSRWGKAMAIYRHRERDGIPQGYERWNIVGVMRHPLQRLMSLYRYMQKIPRKATTPEGENWIRGCAYDTSRPFRDWLFQSQHTFHWRWEQDPRYDMVRYSPITRRSLEDYYVPSLGNIHQLFRLEYDTQEISRYFDIPMYMRENSTMYDFKLWNELKDDEAVQEFLWLHHAYDMTFYEE